MASLTNIFGGPWSPPPEKHIASPEDQLRTAMLSAGLTPPETLNMDGKVHRFNGDGRKDKSAWYCIFGDGVPAGRFGCWRQGLESSFRADVGRTLSATEEMAHTRRMSEAKVLRDAEIARKHEVAADTVEKIWTDCTGAHPEHPYLTRKGIKPHGARVTGDGRLAVPLYDTDGIMASLQYISADGGKLYHPGGSTGGKFWQVGSFDEPGTLYVAEGFATSATIHEVTNRPCVVAYSASNIVPVVAALREKYGATQAIVVVADHDSHGIGQKYADQASAKHGVRVVMPPDVGQDANDYALAGGDLAALLATPSNDWLVHADDFCAQPAPISWLVKHWIQDKALVMVHGPSGGGKTFVVLDWCLRMASATPEWATHKVKPGAVVYLAGEGHHGLRGRVAAWKHQNQSGKLNMWLSRDGCDLNTPAGYLRALENIRALPTVPAVIVVDTLHRFLSGDENSAQDAKTMLDACNALMQEFACTVVLVHHTGVSEEAQHRARGSSAWRGALDIEISIVPAKGDQPMQIAQRKSKDAELAEPIYVSLQSVEIPGWIDEDGLPVTSAVVVLVDAPNVEAKDSKVSEASKVLERAWFASGAEDRGGSPYVSRSALRDLLISDGMSERTAKNKTEPSRTDGYIFKLINADIISSYEHGWIFINEVQASTMMMRR